MLIVIARLEDYLFVIFLRQLKEPEIIVTDRALVYRKPKSENVLLLLRYVRSIFIY